MRLAAQAISDAGFEIQDPHNTTVFISDWLVILNRVCRDVAERFDVCEFEDSANLEPADAYSYPTPMVRIKGIKVSETPTDPTSFVWLDEMYEDEFRAGTMGGYPNATIPTRYFVREGWFHLHPMPTNEIIGGMVMSYFGVPDDVTDPVSGILQFPDFFYDYIVDGMVIRGLAKIEKYAESEQRLKDWKEAEPEKRQRMEDRARDRRPSMRPRNDWRSRALGRGGVYW